MCDTAQVTKVFDEETESKSKFNRDTLENTHTCARVCAHVSLTVIRKTKTARDAIISLACCVRA